MWTLQFQAMVSDIDQPLYANKLFQLLKHPATDENNSHNRLAG